MDIDHFNPLLKGANRNQHGNLLPASSHCNGSKSNKWPTPEQEAKGIRLVNPYEEADYGVHLFENRATGELVGRTIAGRWHIIVLGLNAPHLVRSRLMRTNIKAKVLEAVAKCSADSTTSGIGVVQDCLDELKEAFLDTAIPDLPPA